MALLTRTSMFVGTDIADDGIPAEFKICSLLHVTAVEPLDMKKGGAKEVRQSIVCASIPVKLPVLRIDWLSPAFSAYDCCAYRFRIGGESC